MPGSHENTAAAIEKRAESGRAMTEKLREDAQYLESLSIDIGVEIQGTSRVKIEGDMSRSKATLDMLTHEVLDEMLRFGTQVGGGASLDVIGN